MLILHNVAYAHPNKEMLLHNINLSINKQDKIALIGNNGMGKSTLLKIMADQLEPSKGAVKTEARRYYVPQHFGQFNDYSTAKALGAEEKLNALKDILEGKVTEANMAALDDDWNIEERCHEALSYWQLDDLGLFQPLRTLSGGQKTKVFLAGIFIHQPDIILMDEPSNHLDAAGRNILYDFIQTTTDTLVIVSHDRTLLNLLPTVYELSKQGIAVYGGNYEFYTEQKALEAHALSEDLRSKEKALRKAKEVERAAMERQQKLDARGKKKQEKAGLPTISMNTFRNNAEKSTSRMKDVHAEKTGMIAKEVDQLRKEMPDKNKMKIGFDDSELHTGKILLKADSIQYAYHNEPLWRQPLSFEVHSGQRLAIKGRNGSGKTTLIKLMLGTIQPLAGTLYRADFKAIYIDQDYSLINNTLNVYEQAQQYNNGHLQEHEVKSRLTHFLFTQKHWDKPCAGLSGGEKMRLILCCLTISQHAPDMIILDEPTNNLDIQNIEILTEAIRSYKGTLLVVSHDAYFLKEIEVEDAIELK